MTKKRVIFVMAHSPNEDIRLFKEAKALKHSGYLTSIIYWNREGKSDGLNNIESYDEKLCLRFKAPYGMLVLLFLPVWWSFVFFSLLVKKWDIVHALNFYSIIPSLIAGKLKRKLVIYEILDIYKWVLPIRIRIIYEGLDKLLMRSADAVIVADEAQIELLPGICNSKVVSIYDSPPKIYDKEDIGYERNEVFSLFYAGVLYKIRQLNIDKLIEAIKDIEGVKLIIAGYGDLVDEIKEWMFHMPDKVEFIGKISYEEVIERGFKSDLFFVLRDSAVLTNKYTCGSTLFNAMICGKPILSNKDTSTTIKVRGNNCGLVVDPHNVQEIKEAIINLRDNPQLCEELGANGRRAYEEKYSWEIMEQHLITLYQNLTDELDKGREEHERMEN